MADRITVDADALYRILQALLGPAHHIRELQCTRRLHKLGHPNPIDLLIEDYEAATSPAATLPPAGAQRAVAEEEIPSPNAAERGLSDAEQRMLQFLLSQMADLSDKDWRDHGFRLATFTSLNNKLKGNALTAPAAAPEPRNEALLKLSQFAHTAAHMSEHDMRNNLADIADQLIALAATLATSPFQARVKPWLLECFGEAIASDREERNHRFLEEALELVQACGCTASEAHQLVDYTFGRPAGEKGQEVGGVMVTLAALCLAQDLDMHPEGETELARISAPEIVARIRAKQAAKPKHSPLPGAASMRMCECGKLPHENSCSWEWPNQPQAAPVQDADWRFVATYADTEVRSTTEDKLLAVIHAGPDQQRIVRALRGLTPSECNHG